MLNEMRTVKNLIQYLEDRKDELTDNEKEGYEVALRFLDDQITQIQDDLEREYAEKYTPAESYYGF